MNNELRVVSVLAACLLSFGVGCAETGGESDPPESAPAELAQASLPSSSEPASLREDEPAVAQAGDEASVANTMAAASGETCKPISSWMNLSSGPYCATDNGCPAKRGTFQRQGRLWSCSDGTELWNAWDYRVVRVQCGCGPM